MLKGQTVNFIWRRSWGSYLFLIFFICCAPLPCETCPKESSRIAVDLCVDDTFEKADQLAIWNAADRWTYAFCGIITIDPRLIKDGDTSTCTRSILKVYSTYDWVYAKGPCNYENQTCVAGWTNESRDTSWIIIDYVPENKLETVVAHEIGHLLGADEGLELMDPYLKDSCVNRSSIVQAAIGIKK